MNESGLVAEQLFTLGYTRIRGVLRDSVPDLIALFHSKLGNPHGGFGNVREAKYFDPSAHGEFGRRILTSEIVRLLNDIGSSNLVLAECNLLRGSSLWHRDGANVPRHAYRIAVYLDKIVVGGGALSVIPSSHLNPDDWDQKAASAAGHSGLDYKAARNFDVFASQIESDPGDVILFNCNIVHASFGGGERRQIALVTVGSPEDSHDRQKRTQFILNRHISSTVLFGIKND